ncbi:MAG TPA: Calx-beta domain-containing protein, partial [Tepidisphaeraceae bacterium]|nr:Calx-beta domain-containing protein [Tepidisphaeraceae bacterium]
MKSRIRNSRRNLTSSSRAVQQTIEVLEQRVLLSVATLTNNPTGGSDPGSLTLTVDSYGTFGSYPGYGQSDTLYQPFNGHDQQPSVALSAIYFEPAGGYLSEDVNNPNMIPIALPGVSFTSLTGSQGQANQAVSEFQIAGFDIVLTQTVEPGPTSDGPTQFIQTYQITNVSNAQYNNQPFNIAHVFQSWMPWEGANIDTDNGGMSGDQRILISFDSLGSDTAFERIDASGLDASNTQVADWQLPVGMQPSYSTVQGNSSYFATVASNNGVPAADDGTVVGGTTADPLMDLRTPPTVYTAQHVVLALQDTLTIPIGSTVTYIATTTFGDTGTLTPDVYRKPGTWDVAVTNQNPEGTNATVTISRASGSLGHASVLFDNDGYYGTAVPGQPGDPAADFQDIGSGDSPPNPITLLDGETSTTLQFQIFDDTKIESQEFGVVQISQPTFGATLSGGTNPTIQDFFIPANDQPAPFHFATVDPTTNQAVTMSWPEGTQSATIAVMRNGDDGGNPNTGPYGNFGIGYTITGSGTNPATPGGDLIDDTPNSVLASGTYTGSLQFTGATTAADAQNAQYQYITLTFPTDNVYEGPVTFTITLQASSQPLITNPSTFTGTITDLNASGPIHLDQATETFTIPTDAGNHTIGVTRSGQSTGQVTIAYTVAGGTASDQAQPGVDFTVPNGLLGGNSYTGYLIFDQGSSTPETPIVINLLTTQQQNPDKTLTITLADPNNIPGLLVTPTVETVTLKNINTPGNIAFSGGPTQTIVEGPDPTTGVLYKYMTMEVTRTGGSEYPVSVNFHTSDGTAIAGTDYESASGTLMWAAGNDDPQDILVKVYDNTSDPYPRSDKTFSVSLDSPTGGAVLAAPSSVVVTIVDNQQPGVNLSATSFTAYEKDPSTGQTGTANIVVERDLAAGQSAAPWSFTYALVPGTAKAGVDYVQPTNLTVSVTDPNQAIYTIPITLLTDNASISDTSFTVRLVSASIGGVSAPSSTTAATVTITNANTDIQLSSTKYTTGPGAGTVPITINRTGRDDVPVVVNYATSDGSAKAGTDYTATTGSVTIPAGTDSVTVNVPILTLAGAQQPTRTFSFDITGAALQDPTTDANKVILNYDSTPATVSIAGLVDVTNIQLLSGRPNRIEQIAVTFSDPLGSTAAQNTSNYILTTGGRKGLYNSMIVLADATYISSTQTVMLVPAKPLHLNKVYQLSVVSGNGIQSATGQPFVTGMPGGLGGTAVATFARGQHIKYTDADGDI